MNAELIRFALEHRRKLHEGLCPLHHGVQLDRIEPAEATQLQFDALRLMAFAGITLEEARSAVVSWILHGVAGKLPPNWPDCLPSHFVSDEARSLRACAPRHVE